MNNRWMLDVVVTKLCDVLMGQSFRLAGCTNVSIRCSVPQGGDSSVVWYVYLSSGAVVYSALIEQAVILVRPCEVTDNVLIFEDV